MGSSYKDFYPGIVRYYDRIIIGSKNPQAGYFTSLSASGNATVGGNVAVTGNATVTGNNAVSGSAAVGGAIAADTLINMPGTLPTSGNVTYGAKITGTIPSGSTTGAVLFQSSPKTQAAAFNVGSLWHFQAVQGALGGASTVGTQYGFHAHSSLTGATTNFGFYSDIATAANRWNFYANGTAPNYMRGELGIGIASSSTTQIALAASATGKSSLRITHGVAPTAPADGDMWSTTAGLFIRINGVTKTVTLT